VLRYLLGQLQNRGRVVNLDLRAFGNAQLMASYSQFLREFARQILIDTTGQRPDAVAALVDDTWRYADNPVDNLSLLMERSVLPNFSDGHWLILAIDGVDALSKHPYLEEFSTLLRSWMEDATRPPWSALRLLLSLSTAPRLLISNIDQSPFNVATRIELQDFSPNQVARLARQHGLSWSDADCEQLMALVGGHPYLLRLAMYEASRTSKPLAELLRPSHRLYTEHLERCAGRLRAGNLHAAFSRLLADPQAVLDFDTVDRLRHGGLLCIDDAGGLRPRYALYQRLRP
jgi:hypothetical protein